MPYKTSSYLLQPPKTAKCKVIYIQESSKAIQDKKIHNLKRDISFSISQLPCPTWCDMSFGSIIRRLRPQELIHTFR